MHELFRRYRLNDDGVKKLERISGAFDKLIRELEACCYQNRELAITKTHLETAAMFAVKSMSAHSLNQMKHVADYDNAVNEAPPESDIYKDKGPGIPPGPPPADNEEKKIIAGFYTSEGTLVKKEIFSKKDLSDVVEDKNGVFWLTSAEKKENLGHWKLIGETK